MILLPTLKYDQAIAKQSVHPPSFLPGGEGGGGVEPLMKFSRKSWAWPSSGVVAVFA